MTSVTSANRLALCSSHVTVHRGSGIGEWIEIRVDPDARFDGISLIPGHCRDEASFRRNNWILMLRADDCMLPGQTSAYDLRLLDGESDEDVSANVERRPYSSRVMRTNCTRITILQIARGPDDDTCISEIRPFSLQ